MYSVHVTAHFFNSDFWTEGVTKKERVNIIGKWFVHLVACMWLHTRVVYFVRIDDEFLCLYHILACFDELKKIVESMS